MIKVLNFSDVITNSSSEVFCTITGKEEILNEIFSFLGEGFMRSYCGEGGLDIYDNALHISVSNDVDFTNDMSWECVKLGLEKLLEHWKDKIEISYEL